MRRKFNVKAEADGEAPHKVVAQLLCEDYPLFSFRFFDDSTVKKARDQGRPRHVTRPGGAPFQPRVRPITAQSPPKADRGAPASGLTPRGSKPKPIFPCCASHTAS